MYKLICSACVGPIGLVTQPFPFSNDHPTENCGESVGTNWKNSLVSLNDYNGETIHISFRYICSQGFTEAWLVDQVGIYRGESPELVSFNGINQYTDNDFLNNLIHIIKNFSLSSFEYPNIPNFYL